MVIIMQPLLTNLVSQLEQVIVRMYSDDPKTPVKKHSGSDASKSTLLPELLGKIKWIEKELLGRLSCGADLREWISQVNHNQRSFLEDSLASTSTMHPLYLH
jgi:hypothetical protein